MDYMCKNDGGSVGDERNIAQLSLVNWVAVTVARVLLVIRTVNVPITLLVWSDTYPG